MKGEMRKNCEKSRHAFLMAKIIFLALFFVSPAFSADVVPFISPENSFDAAAQFLNDAENLKIAVYTFESESLAAYIAGKNATIIVEKAPAGGRSDEENEILCFLAENGAGVFLYDGPQRYMHAKYAIAGDSVLVTTENFGKTGFPSQTQKGEANRGWGAVIYDANIAEQFNEIFEFDMKYSSLFKCEREHNIKITKQTPKKYATIYKNQNVAAFFAPDATDEILDLIKNSKNYLYVEQLYIYRDWENQKNPFLEALIEKARQGTDVKILLDATWYNTEGDNDNDETADYVNDAAEKEKLKLEARLGSQKTHIKGLVSDGAVLISSVNWNENSPTRNREAGVVISGAAAEYFKDNFLEGWQTSQTGSATRTQMNIIIAVVTIMLLLIGYVMMRKIKWKNSLIVTTL